MSIVNLYPGEKVSRSAPATAHAPKVVRGERMFRGVLHLTDQRLIFRPDAADPGPGCPGFFPFRRISHTTVFSPKLLGLIPSSRRALRVSTDWGRPGQEPWFVVDDADAWSAAIAQARADAASNPLDLGRMLAAAEAEGAGAISREAFGLFLAEDRGFPGGFWHPEDDEGLLDVIGSRLEALGLAPNVLSDDDLRAELRRAAESRPEDEARRLQIARIAARINEASGAAAGARRLHAFAEDIPGWEADEPVWLLLTADERSRLLALGVVHVLSERTER
jgi:hypothetical protein